MPTPESWLAPALAYIEEWLRFQMRISEQPGCAIAIGHDGELVLELGIGKADVASGEALTPRHRFRVASHSKSFTAAAAMKLREEGRLKLDSQAGEFVSGLHPALATATVGQLLSHTAGVMRDGPNCEYWVDRAPFLDEPALLAELAEAPAIEAATRLKYSNHGFGLVGLVIEKVTGERFADWMTREVVRAAALEETSPDVPLPPGAPLARGHSGKALLGRRVVFPGDQSTGALAPATGFVSTAADLVRFFSQLSPQAEQSFISAGSRREMARPQWTDKWAVQPFTYGLGTISGVFEGWEWFGHSGGFLGYVTRTLVVPGQSLCVSCLTNALDGPAHPWADGALAILKRFAEDGSPSPELGEWRGRWWGAWAPSDLVPVGDKVLVAAPTAQNPFAKVSELTVTGPDQARISQAGAFASFGEAARLVRGADGRVASVQLAGSRLTSEAELSAEMIQRYEAAGASAT